jgi:hypothetical protein
MTDTHASRGEQVARSRRRRPRRNQRCRRESCTRKRNGEYCSSLCAATDKELQTIQVLVGQAGAGKVSTHLWVSAVQLNDALTEVYRLKSVLTNIAEHQGLTDQASSGEGETFPTLPASSSLEGQTSTGAQTLLGENENHAFPKSGPPEPDPTMPDSSNLPTYPSDHAGFQLIPLETTTS